MKRYNVGFAFLFVLTMSLSAFSLLAQDNISWLSDYTSDIEAGSYTYKYNFTSVDGNNCKLKVEEQKTDKKGRTTTMSYVDHQKPCAHKQYI